LTVQLFPKSICQINSGIFAIKMEQDSFVCVASLNFDFALPSLLFSNNELYFNSAKWEKPPGQLKYMNKNYLQFCYQHNLNQ